MMFVQEPRCVLPCFSSESLHSISTGGLGVHVTELAAGLQRRGHDIHVITRRMHEQKSYDCIDGVHYHRVDHGSTENDIEYVDSLCKAIAHRFREVTSMIGKFELAHAHDWMTAEAMKYVMDGFGTPGVLTMHSTEYGRDGNVFYDGFARRVRDAERAGCNNATAVIAVSHFLADELRRFYQVPNEKIHTVPNGVSYDAFNGFIASDEVKGRYSIAPSAPTIFALGRMTAQKGMDILVEAAPMVLASYPEARFVILGEGPEKQAVVRRAQELGATGALQSGCLLLKATPAARADRSRFEPVDSSEPAPRSTRPAPRIHRRTARQVQTIVATT